MIAIYRKSGQYTGFLTNRNLFSWQGQFLGKVDNQGYAWNKEGTYGGRLLEIKGNHYIFKHTYTIPPVSRSPMQIPPTPTLPAPMPSVPPLDYPIGFEDSF